MNNNENLKRHQFSFNLAGLQTYTDEVGGQLVMEAVVKAKTARIGYVQSGIKGSQSLNLLTSNLQVQQGNCGWSPSGTTTFSQRNIEVCSYRVNEALCPEQLNQYWLGQFLNAGSYNEQVPFEETIAKLKTEQVQKFVEDTLWKATTGGTDCFQGFYYIFGTGATEPVNFVVSPITAFTSANMLSIVDQVITALPDKVQEDDDLVVMMSMANYRLYTIGLRNANYYNFGAETREAGTEFITYHPGTNIEVVGIPGMVGTNQVVCGKKSQLIIGTDLMSDSERMEIFYDKNDDEVRVRCNFKIGAQIPFPSNWVSNGLS